MLNNERPASVYEDLADWYDRTGQAKLRDWFLVLAADEALANGCRQDAERLRSRLLTTNPHHLLKPYASFAEALQSPDVQGYVADLRRTYPPEAAAALLATHRQTAADRGTHGHPPPLKAAGPSPPSTELFPSATAEPKAFRVQPPAEEPKAKPNPTAPRPSAPGPPRPRMPQPAPVRGPIPGPLPRSAIEAARGARSRENVEDGATGAWVSSALYFLLLLASIALALHTFAEPFLPAGWLR